MKTKMCKFHMEGRCKHGADCRFAHTQADIGLPREGNAFMTFPRREEPDVLLSLVNLLQ